VNATAVAASFRLQCATSVRQPAQFLVLITAPLLSTIFFSVVDRSGSTDERAGVVVTPALIGLWFVCLDLAAGTFKDERFGGTLENLIVAPASLPSVLVGRIAALLCVGAVASVESALIAAFGFGFPLHVHHPVVFALTCLATLFTTGATAAVLATGFALTRNTIMLQNALSYPVYIFGGVLVPLSLLPSWLEPFGRLIYLSWASDLLRACLSPRAVPDWPLRVLVIAGFGAVALLVSGRLARLVLARLHATGTAVRA
jgi:ABC-2 type transport system permease protein